MKSIGKTYLIEVEKPKEEIINGIIIPQTATNRNSIFYIGKIIEYGIGFSEEEKKDLIPIGTTVIMDYTKNAKHIKVILADKLYYIYKPENILGIIKDKEDK